MLKDQKFLYWTKRGSILHLGDFSGSAKTFKGSPERATLEAFYKCCFRNIIVLVVSIKNKKKGMYAAFGCVYRIVSNKRPGGVAIFQKGDVYKRQLFNAKMQCLSLFTMTRHREIWAFYLVLFENKLGGRLLEGERLLETIRYLWYTSLMLPMLSYSKI